jgi:PAS domain S-box-containing protein
MDWAAGLSPLQIWIAQLTIGVACAVLALALTLIFSPIMDDSRFLFFVFGIVVAAYAAGLRGGVTAALISVFVIDFFVFYPIYDFTLFAHPVNLLQIILFLWVAIVISLMQERRLAAERLSRLLIEQRNAILDSVVDGITAQEANGQVIFANQAAAIMTGYASTQEILEPIHKMQARYEIFDIDGSPLPYSALPRNIVFKEGRSAERVFCSRMIATGEERWLHVRSAPVFDRAGAVKLAVNVLRDVTRERKVQREMIEMSRLVLDQRQRLDNLIANLPGIIWEGEGVPTKGQQMTFISEYAIKMLGYPRELWLSDPDLWKRIVHPDDVEMAAQRAVEIFESGQPGSIQIRFIAHDGHLVYAETHTSVEHRDDGTSKVYGVIMDISERKQYEDALAEYAANLCRSNEELEQFAYVASHDLQEPLRMVTSYLQLLEGRYADKLDEDARDFIHYAVDGASRMKGLINDLLLYSRVQRKRDDFKSVPLLRALEQALDNLQLLIEDHDATVIHDSLPTIYGNEAQLVQLFQNLINNAIKFRRDEPPIVQIGVKRLRREWEFAVRDNGIGIDRQYLSRIFVIFQRLHTKEKYPGTGIGLAICKKVVENHRGRIWVESAPGEGTTFYFTLPLGDGVGLEDDTNHGNRDRNSAD